VQILVTVRLLELVLPKQLDVPIDPLLDSRELVVDSSGFEVGSDGAAFEEGREASVEEGEVGEFASHLVESKPKPKGREGRQSAKEEERQRREGKGRRKGEREREGTSQRTSQTPTSLSEAAAYKLSGSEFV